MKRCTKCILPESYPSISFDQDGVCNRCSSWQQEFEKVDYESLRKELDVLIQQKKKEARAAGIPFDVIVPVSGGKDSAYALYVMKEIYNCRVLTVNYNNSFQTELAYRNIMNLVNTFNVEFRMIAIQPGLLKEAYQAGMKVLNEFCLVCNCTGYWLMMSFLADQFSKYNYTPLIVGGWSKLFEFDPQINTLNFLRYRELLSESNLLDRFAEVLNIDVLNALSDQTDVRQNKTGGFIQLPDYWPWDHHEIIETLHCYGWKKLKGKDTHFDCWASPLADRLEKDKYGMTQKTTIQSSYIRAGMVDRAGALMQEELSFYEPVDQDLWHKFSRHIGLKDVEFTRNICVK
ncbi:MAG: hypothetical protein ACERKD_19300 [Prolixibacteraceae bacterium]